MSLRLVVADDHQLLRDGLRALAGSGALGDVDVVGDASDVYETKRLVEQQHPDVVVLDLKMPGGSSIELVRDLVKVDPNVKVLILTSYDDTAFVRSAIAAGARGYLLKRSAHSELSTALQALHEGRIFIDPSLSIDLGDDASQRGARGPDKLTPREREVLVLLARGLTYSAVGKKLHIGVRTVETHRRKVADKLGLENRADLVRFALEFGLVRSGDVEASEPGAEP